MCNRSRNAVIGKVAEIVKVKIQTSTVNFRVANRANRANLRI
jgi:hypothetical protein